LSTLETIFCVWSTNRLLLRHLFVKSEIDFNLASSCEVRPIIVPESTAKSECDLHFTRLSSVDGKIGTPSIMRPKWVHPVAAKFAASEIIG
jgi:hypothetical protein